MDINALIAQMAGGGGNAPTQMPSAQMPQQAGMPPGGAGGLPPEIAQLLQMIGPDAGAPKDLMSDNFKNSRAMQDPAFADAAQEWIDENGHEPATDAELAEVEAWAEQMREAHGMDKERKFDRDMER